MAYSLFKLSIKAVGVRNVDSKKMGKAHQQTIEAFNKTFQTLD